VLKVLVGACERWWELVVLVGAAHANVDCNELVSIEHFRCVWRSPVDCVKIAWPVVMLVSV